MEHVRATQGPPEVWMERYRKCRCVNQVSPSEMAEEDIRTEISTILFDKTFWAACGATDRELLTIIVVKEKAPHFEFLRAYTTWKVFGLWERQKELNLQIDCEFRDNEEECLGNRLMHLLYEYNHQVVKEEVLYARTSPIEEGTLFP